MQYVDVAAVSDWVSPGCPAAPPHIPLEPNTEYGYTEDIPRSGHALSAPQLRRKRDSDTEGD